MRARRPAQVGNQLKRLDLDNGLDLDDRLDLDGPGPGDGLDLDDRRLRPIPDLGDRVALDQGKRLHVGLLDGFRDRLVLRRGDLLDCDELLALRGLVARRRDGVELDDLRLAHLAARHGLVDGRHLLAERAGQLELADDARARPGPRRAARRSGAGASSARLELLLR